MRKITFVAVILALSGCATRIDMPMSTVMARCDVGTNVGNFSFYSYCIKDVYSREGNQPNSPAIRAFYSRLDVIDENYCQNKITNAEAKSYAYQAWREMIDADNQREEKINAQRNSGANAALIGIGLGMMNGAAPQQAPTQYKNPQVCAYDQWGNQIDCYFNYQNCMLVARNRSGVQCH